MYEPQRGIGKIVDGAYRSEPAYTIASKKRTPVDAGGHSPGPIYEQPPPLGRKQPTTDTRSAPKVTFARHSRWAAHEAELRRNSVPGPASYG